MSGEVIDLRARLEQVPMPADGPPAITFGWDERDPVTFRDMATLEEFVEERATEILAARGDSLAGKVRALADEWETECPGSPHRLCKGGRLRALLDAAETTGETP